jgi:hypothetical protein
VFLPIDDDVLHTRDVLLVKGRVSCTSPRGIGEGIVRVKQATEFDDPDKHGEEEKARHRELRDSRASFTLF